MKRLEHDSIRAMKAFSGKHPDAKWHAYEHLVTGRVLCLAIGKGCFHTEVPQPSSEYRYLGVVDPAGDQGVIT